jgi:hypothetical protein
MLSPGQGQVGRPHAALVRIRGGLRLDYDGQPGCPLARAVLSRRTRSAALNVVWYAQQDDRVGAQFRRQRRAHVTGGHHGGPTRRNRHPAAVQQSGGEYWIAAQ